jgi:hypothetical protein
MDTTNEIKTARTIARVAASIHNACSGFAAGVDALSKDDARAADMGAEWLAMVNLGLLTLRKSGTKGYHFHDAATIGAWIDAKSKSMEAKREALAAQPLPLSLTGAAQHLAHKVALADAQKALGKARSAMALCKDRIVEAAKAAA